MPDTERPTPRTPEARASLFRTFWGLDGEATKALADQFRAAEAPLRERIGEVERALRDKSLFLDRYRLAALKLEGLQRARIETLEKALRGLLDALDLMGGTGAELDEEEIAPAREALGEVKNG